MALLMLHKTISGVKRTVMAVTDDEGIMLAIIRIE